jgi:hypothetical protein
MSEEGLRVGFRENNYFSSESNYFCSNIGKHRNTALICKRKVYVDQMEIFS